MIAPRFLIPLGLVLAFQEVLLGYFDSHSSVSVASWLLSVSNVMSQVGGFLFFAGLIIYLKNTLMDGVR
jgi:hypothetical protein